MRFPLTLYTHRFSRLTLVIIRVNKTLNPTNNTQINTTSKNVKIKRLYRVQVC